MPFVRGESLARLVDRTHPFQSRDAVTLVRKVAGALHYAHQQGVLHRDLKPANILIDDRGEPMVMDFGLAHLDSATPLTQQGEVLGTPAYMSPEQITGNLQAVSPASDVYSLGAVLYQLLTGTPPFLGDLLTLVAQVPFDEPVPPSARRPGLDPRLDPVCLKALAKRPAERWPSMQHFAAALEDALDLEPRPSPVGPGRSLTLRVEGTLFAYRPAPGQEVITVGRQKRRPGGPADQGNDLVLRMPGNDQLSARISRRHLAIRRSGDGFVVVDHSKAGTLHNGQPLPPEVPTPLRPGDRLVVAGVLTLEVALQDGPVSGPCRTQVELSHPTAPFVLEATFGDLITFE
jgi:serine/threonine protein kinase